MRGRSNGARWVSIETAALHLDLTSTALRKAFERRARRKPDGGIEAELDGVHGRKLGRLWRVQMSDAWGVPVADVDDVGSAGRRSGRDGSGSSQP